jgi:hypothetical protein
VAFSQTTDEPSESQATVTGATAVPAAGSVLLYQMSQAPILSETFGISPPSLVIFMLESSAIDNTDAMGSASDVGIARWTSLHISPYDPTELSPTHPACATMQDPTTAAALLIGRMEGPYGVRACLAWAFDVADSGGVVVHYLIPLALVDAETEEIADLVFGWFGPRLWSTDPCSDDYYCDTVYRQRISNALEPGLFNCLKNSVPPLNIWNAACFVFCVPLLSGTPLLYLACAAACNMGVSGIPTGIDTVACMNQLKSDRDNAKQSYCSCLAYKLQHCPDFAEVDLVGCP